MEFNDAASEQTTNTPVLNGRIPMSNPLDVGERRHSLRRGESLPIWTVTHPDQQSRTLVKWPMTY